MEQLKGFVEYLPRLPDLISLDFFMAYLKAKAYTIRFGTIVKLRAATGADDAHFRLLFCYVCNYITSPCQQCLNQFENRQ